MDRLVGRRPCCAIPGLDVLQSGVLQKSSIDEELGIEVCARRAGMVEQGQDRYPGVSQDRTTHPQRRIFSRHVTVDMGYRDALCMAGDTGNSAGVPGKKLVPGPDGLDIRGHEAYT